MAGVGTGPGVGVLRDLRREAPGDGECVAAMNIDVINSGDVD